VATLTSPRGSCSKTVDQASWVITLRAPEEQDFSGKTLEEALGWCLVWLMAPELGIGSFLVWSIPRGRQRHRRFRARTDGHCVGIAWAMRVVPRRVAAQTWDMGSMPRVAFREGNLHVESVSQPSGKISHRRQRRCNCSRRYVPRTPH
jgi:hypothetical protein